MKHTCHQTHWLNQIKRFGVLLLVVLLTGCASQRADSSARPVDQFGVDPFTPVKKLPDPQQLLGPMTKAQPFDVVQGSQKGRQWIYSHTPGDAKGQQLLTFAGQHQSLLKPDVDGNMRLLWEIDYAHQVKVVYDPPIMLIPARLDAISDKPEQHKMVCYSLDGKSTRDKGTCDVTMQVLGKQTLHTSAGKFTPIVFKTTRQLDLGLAKGTVTIFDAYVPGKGLVAHRVVRKLATMGFIPMNSTLEVQRAR